MTGWTKTGFSNGPEEVCNVNEYPLQKDLKRLIFSPPVRVLLEFEIYPPRTGGKRPRGLLFILNRLHEIGPFPEKSTSVQLEPVSYRCTSRSLSFIQLYILEKFLKKDRRMLYFTHIFSSRVALLYFAWNLKRSIINFQTVNRDCCRFGGWVIQPY